jgi:hypothetical protein
MTDVVSDAAPVEPPSRSTHDWLAGALVALATVLAVTSVFSTWVRVQALDTDAWVSLSDQLLDEPEVQSALAVYLVDELYRQLDVTAEIQDTLPDNLKGLAGPLTAALRGPATTGVERLIASDQFRATWMTVNRTAHQTLVNILRDETRQGISTTGGAVTLELGELIRVVGENLGLSDALLDRLPADAGRVTVFESDQLDTAQRAVQLLDFMSWFLFVLVVALYAAAVYIATGRRLAMLRNVGLSLIGASTFVLIVLAIAVRTIVDAIVANPANRPLAGVAAYVGTGLVRQMAWSGILYGLVIVGFTMVLGERRWATSTRRSLAPLFNVSDAAVAGGTAMLVIILLWWSPGRAFDRWVTGITLILLVVGAVIALRRSIRREFPDVTFDAAIGSLGLGARFSGGATSFDPLASTTAAQMETLRGLHESGALDDDEYARAKERVNNAARLPG